MEENHEFDLGDLVVTESDLTTRMEILAFRDGDAYCRREIDRKEDWYPLRALRPYSIENIPPTLFMG